MTTIPIPDVIHTDRLCLRSFTEADAEVLLPVLQANGERLVQWIPPHVGLPAPLPELRSRLAAFADDFRSARSWRFGVFPPDQSDIYGEVDLFFRNADGRVHSSQADRVEIGYWLREDAEGRGYATEAARAMMSLAQRLPGIRSIEIRCDARNQPSMAVAQRLGFHRREAVAGADPHDVLWVYDLHDRNAHAASQENRN